MENNADMDTKPIVSCGACVYWDRVSVLVEGHWRKTRTGHCLNEDGSVNAQQFYSKCYIDTKIRCAGYNPLERHQ